MANLIRVKQLDQPDLSGFFNTAFINTGIFDATFVDKFTDQNISGIKTFIDGVNLNNIDNLSLSGVDITITSGNVTLTNPVSAPNLFNITYNTGNQTISGVKTFATGIFAPNLVYNTGNQTISGIKTFSAPHYDPGELSSLGISIYPSGQGNIVGPLIKSNEGLTIAGSNTNQKIIFSDENTVIHAGVANIEVSTAGNGEIYLNGQTVGKTGTFEKINGATNLVYNTGNQIISGVKTFATGIFDKASGNFILFNSATAPSSPAKGQLFFDTINNNFSGYNGTSWLKLNN